MSYYFKTSFGKTYVQLEVPVVDTTNSNIICCVDVSGSMSGAPLKNVNMVLKDIYDKTKSEFTVFSYDTTVQTHTLSQVAASPLTVRGGTSFRCIFDKISATLTSNPKPTTFIFMTDGEDTSGDRNALKQSITQLRMVMSALKNISVTIHVIGFGSVKADFLEQVRTFGTKDGLFKYSTQSAELQNDFNDMFEYSISTREIDVVLGGKLYEIEDNSSYVKFLVDDDLTGEVEVKLKIDGVESTKVVKSLENIQPIHNINALNQCNPEDEDQVKNILRHLNTIPIKGNDKFEKMEVEQMKEDISNRMMQFLNVFTQIKGGMINEDVKLKLQSLLHKAKFDDMNRKKKMDMRVNKNAEYFKKTDIPGILKGFRDNMASGAWDELRKIQNKWTCVYSKESLFELMHKSTDNVLCLGILVDRKEGVVENPEKGLKLIKLSSSLISFDSFMDAIVEAKKHDAPEKSFSDSHCIVGSSNEMINAIIPLYIHPEHMKRVRILEGIILGHMYTQNSYGYDKRQEIGMIKLVHEIIMTHEKTEWTSTMVDEIMKVCEFFVKESEGFKSAYGSQTHDLFLSSIKNRNGPQVCDLSIPLMVGFFTGTLKETLNVCYREYIMRHHKGCSASERKSIVNRLLYGESETKIVVQTAEVHQGNDLNYIETSYAGFFHDEQNKPVPLIAEKSTLADRKLLVCDNEYVKSFILPVPDFIKKFLKWVDNDYDIITNIDIELLRKELLVTMHYPVVPSTVSMDNIISVIDDDIQGRFDDAIEFDKSEESINTVVYVASNTNSMECFAGLLHKYAPKMFGVFFEAIVLELIKGTCVKAKEKLETLLTFDVGYSKMYKHNSPYIWQPYRSIVDKITDIVGVDRLKYIESNYLNTGGSRVYWTYRFKIDSNGDRILCPANRHGYSNYKPNLNHVLPFRGYYANWSGMDYITT
jgi:hypothetical protein